MKPGIRVFFLHEKGGGVLKRIEGQTGYVETDEGWELPYPLSSLSTMPENDSVPKENNEKSKPLPKEALQQKVGNLNPEKMEWDIPKKIIPRKKDPAFRIDKNQIGETARHEKKKVSTNKEEVWEVDLHIHELLDDYRHLSNGEIVQKQLMAFHAFMEKAIRQHIRRVIIIHGVGTGKLKEEVYQATSRYHVISIHDASYQKYGRGATEIILSMQ